MSESPRYNWPIPQWNADWQSWQQRFEDLSDDIDSTVFSNMEGSKCIFYQLPNARVYDDSGTYKLEMLSDLILISRTYNMKVTVDSSSDLVLIPYNLIGLTFTAGTVEETTVEFELFNTAPIDSDVHIFGYVTADYSVNWFNGSVFADGEDARQIFSFLASTGADTNKVKVTNADTTADFLSSKITSGSNITINVLNPGGDEELEIVATSGYWSRNAVPAYVYPTTDTDAMRIGDGSVSVPGIASKTYVDTGFRWDVTESPSFNNEDSIYFVSSGSDVASVYYDSITSEQVVSFVDEGGNDNATIRKRMNPGTLSDLVILNIEVDGGVNTDGSQLILKSMTNDDMYNLQTSVVEIESIASGLDALSVLKASTGVAATSGTAEVQILAEGYNEVKCLIRAQDLAANDTTSLVILSDGGIQSDVSIKAEGTTISNAEFGTDPSTGYAYTDLFAISTDSLSSMEIISQSGGGGNIDAELDIKALNNGTNAYDDATVVVRSYAATGYASVVIGATTTEDVILSVSDSVFFKFADVDKLEVYHSTDTVVFSTFEPDDTLSVLEFSHKKYVGTSEAAVEFNVIGDTGTGGSRFTINSYNYEDTDKADIEIYANGGTPRIDIVATSTGSGLAEANLYADGNVTGDGEVVIEATSAISNAAVYISAEGSASGLVLLGSPSTNIVAFTDVNSSVISGTWTNQRIDFSSATSEWTTYNSNFGEVSLLAALNVAYTSGGGSVSEPAGQIVYGTGTGVDSSSIFMWDTVNSVFIVGHNGTRQATSLDSKAEIQDGITSGKWTTTLADSSALSFIRSYNVSVGSHTAVPTGGYLGEINFYGSSGSDWVEGARIIASAASTFSGTNSGSDLSFYITEKTTTTPALAMRLDSNGYLSITDSSSAAATAALEIFGNGENTYDNILALSFFSDYTGEQPIVRIRKSQTDTIGYNYAVSNGSALGQISFEASNGTSFESAIEFRVVATSTWSGSSEGARLELWQSLAGDTGIEKSVVIYRGDEILIPASGYSTVHMHIGDDGDHESLVVRANNFIVFQDANTLDGSYMGGNIVVGGGNDFDGSYLSDSIIVGNSNSFTTSLGLIYRGNSNTISSVYDSLLLLTSTNPIDITKSIAICTSSTFQGCSNTIVVGSAHVCKDSSHSLMTGYECYSDSHLGVVVRGQRSKADFDYGEFFTAGRLDGSTLGSSQAFKAIPMMYRTTDTTPTVLTTTGSGTTSPLVIEEGYLYCFECRLVGSVDGTTTDAYEVWVWDIEVWKNAVNGVEFNATQRYNYAAAGGAGTATWQKNDTDSTLELKVTSVVSTVKVDWFAHIWGGIKVQTLYDAIGPE
jgi:hypothetical protein